MNFPRSTAADARSRRVSLYGRVPPFLGRRIALTGSCYLLRKGGVTVPIRPSVPLAPAGRGARGEGVMHAVAFGSYRPRPARRGGERIGKLGGSPPHPQPLIGTNETEVDRKSGVSGSSNLSFFLAPCFLSLWGCGFCGKPWPQTSLGSTVRVTTATSGYEYPTPTVRRFGRDFRTGPLLEVQRILRGCPSRTHYKGFAAPSPRVVDTSIREETHEFRP
jgi:hypothetical protein